MCNGIKHKILHSIRSKEDPVKKVNPSEITADSTAYTADSMMEVNSKTYEIQLESGKKYEILFFANRIVELWFELIFEHKT